jgi:sec-independent protein translocase protein TatC
MLFAAVADVVEEETESGKQLELMEHLSELRNRIVRCLIYTALGAGAGWFFFPFFFKILTTPVVRYLSKDSSFLLTGIAEGFTVKVQISVLTGIILAFPLITMEGWRFVAPGLTKKERRAIRLVAPLSVLLFAAGIATAYIAMPMGIRWLISQNPPDAKFMPAVGQSLIFILKMYLAFGLVFQTPIILMFLGRVGIVTSKSLRSYWRQALVLIAFVAAAVTPSGDAFTMMIMCGPMVVLYFMSIGLVRLVEPRE